MTATGGRTKENSKAWTDPRLQDTVFLSADYRHQVFDRHFHEEFAIGVIESGCQQFVYDGRRSLDMTGGSVALIAPGIVHSGTPGEMGWRYRMLYPAKALVQRLLAESVVVDCDQGFHAPSVLDDDLYRRLAALHLASEAGDASSLELESRLLEILVLAFTRHAGVSRRVGRQHNSTGLLQARDALMDRLSSNLTLDDLASIAHLSRFKFLRQFRSMFGLPPHAFLRLARVRLARDFIRSGLPLAESAFAVGFADQAHMNRAFRRTLGFTPGVLAKNRTMWLQFNSPSSSSSGIGARLSPRSPGVVL